jgi:hypothetical protein
MQGDDIVSGDFQQHTASMSYDPTRNRRQDATAMVLQLLQEQVHCRYQTSLSQCWSCWHFLHPRHKVISTTLMLISQPNRRVPLTSGLDLVKLTISHASTLCREQSQIVHRSSAHVPSTALKITRFYLSSMWMSWLTWS